MPAFRPLNAVWDFFVWLLNDMHLYALAWMCFCRFHAHRRREVRAREEVESGDSNHAQNRKKMEIRAQPTKPSTRKSSVLQSIYGELFFCFIIYVYNKQQHNKAYKITKFHLHRKKKTRHHMEGPHTLSPVEPHREPHIPLLNHSTKTWERCFVCLVVKLYYQWCNCVKCGSHQLDCKCAGQNWTNLKSELWLCRLELKPKQETLKPKLKFVTWASTEVNKRRSKYG